MELQEAYARFRACGSEIIAVAVQDQAQAGLMRRQTGAEFPILADVTHLTANQYNVYNVMGDGVAAPAVFVINSAGEIVWSYIGRDAGDRPAPDQILSRLP